MSIIYGLVFGLGTTLTVLGFGGDPGTVGGIGIGILCGGIVGPLIAKALQ